MALSSESVHWTKDPRAGTDASPVPLTPNQHWTIDPHSGERVVDFEFIEEPLGMPSDIGCGFPYFEFGDLLGERYKVLRKLGWGLNSSTWLVEDEGTHTFRALKALTGHCTSLTDSGLHWELEALKRVKSASSPHCLDLTDHFVVPGKQSAGSHLCLVTQLLGGDVTRLARSHNILRYPLPAAKRILLHVLRALAILHGRGIVHTDLKTDNIFYDNPLAREDIVDLLRSDPSRRHPAEGSFDGIVHVAVSQPLPLPPLDELTRRTFTLGDLGSAQLIGERKVYEITPISLRPPEVYLGAEWDEKVDMWSFGCLVYEVITGVPLFDPKRSTSTVDGIELDLTESLLHQMIAHTNDIFAPDQLSVSSRAGQYFDECCGLKKNPGNYHYQSEHWVVRDSDGDYTLEEAKEVVRFMRKCLRLNPKDRASAEELLQDPWLSDAEAGQ